MRQKKGYGSHIFAKSANPCKILLKLKGARHRRPSLDVPGARPIENILLTNIVIKNAEKFNLSYIKLVMKLSPKKTFEIELKMSQFNVH